MKPRTEATRLAEIYYSPVGYWKGIAAIKKLAAAAKVSETTALEWLKRQSIWQIYLPAPRYIPRPKFDVSEVNEVHQADLLFLPHDKIGRRTYKYALTLVDVGSRYKAAEPLTSKSSEEVAGAFERIYKRGPLVYPKLLQVDPGREFMGSVSTLMAKHKTAIRRGRPEIHRDQALVERWNRSLAEKLFGHQYAQEMLLAARGSSQRSVEWVARLQAVVSAMNDEVTRLTGKKPSEAIKLQTVHASPSLPAHRTVGLQEPIVPSDAQVRYLYQPGELEGGRPRATDPVWSVTTHSVRNVVRQNDQPAVYYLDPPGPERGFVREELLLIPPEGAELPPDKILTRQLNT